MSKSTHLDPSSKDDMYEDGFMHKRFCRNPIEYTLALVTIVVLITTIATFMVLLAHLWITIILSKPPSGIELFLTAFKITTVITACLIFLEIVAFVWWRLMRLFGCGSQYFGFPVFELVVDLHHHLTTAIVGEPPAKRSEYEKIPDEESQVNEKLDIDASDSGGAAK